MAQNQDIYCIRCLNKPADAKSHIVPNSIRKRMFGEKTAKGTKFEFSFLGRPDLKGQDFPKPNLMCVVCDNQFGADLEKTLPQLLMPAADVGNPKSWNSLGLINLNHGPFQDYPLASQPLLKLNAALIAWKVMHAVEREGRTPELSSYLKTAEGKALDRAMLDFINNQPLPPLPIPFGEPVFWKMKPQAVAAFTGKNDEFPVAWGVTYERGKPQTASIFALFGLWVVGWQLPAATLPVHFELAQWFEHLLTAK